MDRKKTLFHKSRDGCVSTNLNPMFWKYLSFDWTVSRQCSYIRGVPEPMTTSWHYYHDYMGSGTLFKRSWVTRSLFHTSASLANWHLCLLFVNQMFQSGTLLPDDDFHFYFKRHWVTHGSPRCYWSARYGPGMIHDSPVFPCFENLTSSRCFGVEWPLMNAVWN